MPDLPIRGKKYICKQCEIQKTVEYKDSYNTISFTDEDCQNINALQLRFGEKGYVYEVDAVCETCFNAMLKDSDSLCEDLSFSEQEYENVLSLQRCSELIDREYWEKIGQVLLEDIYQADLEFFKKINVRLYRKYILDSNNELDTKITDYWLSLDHEKLLVNWITARRIEFTNDHMLWNCGHQSLQNCMQSCFNRLGDMVLALPLEFKNTDTLGLDHKFILEPRDEQEEGCFYFIANAQSYVMHRFQEMKKESIRERVFEQVMKCWCGRLGELLSDSTL
ncbi:hypothetical protein [Desulfonatronum thiodismutans]|uniref:hypothetical protein n=1 Tax=Desulfonatronum thiodismutans TaxID=159290 RepID=UPI0004ABEAA1|nr:hypothetical protein [Desulfonatronum thiodismutans]